MRITRLIKIEVKYKNIIIYNYLKFNDGKVLIIIKKCIDYI